VNEGDVSEAVVPFGQDFTPATLGKNIGEQAVLGWLLEKARAGDRPAFTKAVCDTCLNHVEKLDSRRDMAAHVVAAMRAYKLVTTPAKDVLQLTDVGAFILDAPESERDLLFARHILTMCNGQQFLDAIRRYELRGETPDLEDLATELEGQPTSKSISTLRAWLGRAGAVSSKGPYAVLDDGVERILGQGVAAFYGLDAASLDFLLAARILAQQQGGGPLDAVVVANVAEQRADGLRIPRKSLDKFVRGLAKRDLVTTMEALPGKGGSRTSFELKDTAIHITEEQLRELLAQSHAGIALWDLRPLAEVVPGLDQGNAESIGHFGEQLAVHLCLLLGLRVRSWRKRSPQSEIDLIAERLSGLSYQRWFVQVKNTADKLDGDQVDREIGASVGLGVTHILFVVPRAGVTQPAQYQIRLKSRVTPLHLFYLTKPMIVVKKAEPILVELQRQARQHQADKRDEAEARERR
jgi:hypothetical protein